MDAIYAAYDERLQELIKNFVTTLEGLPAEALDWSPGPELNSLAVLAVHSVGATRYWLGDVMMGEPSGRIREVEFQTKETGASELRQRFMTLLDYVQKQLSSLTSADLQREVYAERQNRNVTVAYALLRALDHLAEHLAHAQMTRQLWEQQGKNASATQS